MVVTVNHNTQADFAALTMILTTTNLHLNGDVSVIIIIRSENWPLLHTDNNNNDDDVTIQTRRHHLHHTMMIVNQTLLLTTEDYGDNSNIDESRTMTVRNEGAQTRQKTGTGVADL